MSYGSIHAEPGCLNDTVHTFFYSANLKTAELMRLFCFQFCLFPVLKPEFI
jgi:hypothetical protein